MIPESHEEVVKQLQDEIQRLQRLVFQSVPMKRGGIGRLWPRNKPKGFGGAGEYEVWLRTLDHSDLNHLIKLHTGDIDSLRYRRRFIQHESERRFLHSSYGATPIEDLFDASGGLS